MDLDPNAVALELADAVIGAPPYGAADAAAARLALRLAAEDVTIWQTDYSMRTLHPVASWPDDRRPDPIPVTAPEAQAFRTQRPVGTASQVIVPLTVRGHRHGMLAVSLPSERPRALDTVQRCADLLSPLLAQASHGDDVFEIRRRSQRLSLAAELQWQILPSPGLRTERFSVYAQLEPAHLVSSDAFDWSYDGERLTVAVLDTVGEGVGAAQSTDLAMTALRNARRAQLPLAECVSLADQALWDETRGGCVVRFLAVEYDFPARIATLVGGGSPRLLRWQGGELTVIEYDSDVPLGESELSVFRPQQVPVPADGALDLLVTDGVLEATNQDGARFGTEGVKRLLRSSDIPLWEIPRLIVAAVRAHCGDSVPDDASCVLVGLDG